MKYIAAIVIVAIILRIDVIMRLFDKASDRFESRTPDISEIDLSEVTREIPAGNQNLKQSPKNRFIGLLQTFRVTPDATYRSEAMALFKSHPTMFTEKLDPDLESALFEWRDLILQSSPELPEFLLELQGILKGENLETVTKLFAILLDQNLDLFLNSYIKTKDTNCMIATVVGDNIPDAEKVNELFDREKSLSEYLLREKVDPKLAAYVNSCLLVLRLHLAKVAPIVQPTDEPLENTETEFPGAVPTSEGP